jgi:hypothetical protein
MYGHSTDLCIDAGTNKKYWKVRQLTDSGYQDLQHHLLTFRDRASNRLGRAFKYLGARVLNGRTPTNLSHLNVSLSIYLRKFHSFLAPH